jgi:MFS family permease
VNGREARLIFASGIGWMFDAMDVLLLSYILVAASHELGLTKGDEGLVILANNVGILIGAFLWLPTMLARRGYGLVRTFGYSLAMSLAQLPGYLTAAYLVERIGRRPSLLAFFAGSAAAAAAFALAPSTAWLLASGVALNFFNLGAWGLIYAYTPESFPSDLRGTSMGSSGSMARVA